MDVIDEIAIHLTNRSRAVSLSEAAGFAHVTPNYLCRIFKEHTGDSPMGYLQTVRMREAEKLLSFTDLPVYTKWSRFHPKLRGYR